MSSVGIAIGGIGTTQIESAEGYNWSSDTSTDQGTISLDEDEPGSKRRWEDLMRDRAGSPSIMSGVNLEYEAHWESESSTSADCAFSDGKSEGEHVLTARKAVDDDGDHIIDSDGNYRYVIELWSQVEKTSGGGALCGETFYIQDLEWYLESDEDEAYLSGAVFHDRDPVQKTELNEETFVVDHSQTVGPISYGQSEIVETDDGLFGADSWTPGPGGEYVVTWEGEEDLVDLIALVDVATPCEIDFDGGCDNGLRWGYSVSTGFN